MSDPKGFYLALMRTYRQIHVTVHEIEMHIEIAHMTLVSFSDDMLEQKY